MTGGKGAKFESLLWMIESLSRRRGFNFLCVGVVVTVLQLMSTV